MSDPHLERALSDLRLHVPHPRRILAVDDEPDNLEVLSAVLDERFKVLTASDASSALRMLEEHSVDLIISDQRMPGMTGVELLAAVAEKWPETIRIVLTAYTDVDPMLEAINKGSVYRFLFKPFDSDELRSIVADALELKWASSALWQVVHALAEQNKQLYATHIKLAEAQRALLSAERLAALGRLAAGVAHDVRNQLGIISLLMQLVEQKSRNPSTLRAAQKVRDSSLSLLELLECVRKIGRAAASSGAIKRVNVRRFLDGTIETLRREPLQQDRKVDVAVSSPLIDLAIDTDAIREAVLALLRGTLAVSESVTPIELTAQQAPNGVAFIEILDKNFGYDSKDPQHIFEQTFRQIGRSDLLVGLQIAQLTAEAHGGRVEFVTSLSHGTRTRLYLANSLTDVE